MKRGEETSLFKKKKLSQYDLSIHNNGQINDCDWGIDSTGAVRHPLLCVYVVST